MHVFSGYGKARVITTEHVDKLTSRFQILSRDDLNVRNEELLFDAIVRWVDYDPAHRKQAMPKLMRSIRLGLLTTQYFVEKVTRKLLSGFN